MGVDVRFTKWGGHPHYRYEMASLGADRYGWWLGGRTGIEVRRGEEQPVIQPHDFVTLVPDDGCWLAHWNGPAEPDVAIYVDVTTRPERRPDAVHAVDLDLDVVQLRDGTVRVLDADEFAEHRVRYGYPPDVIAEALATTDDLVARITAGDEPFGTVGAGWLAEFTGGSAQLRPGPAPR